MSQRRAAPELAHPLGGRRRAFADAWGCSLLDVNVWIALLDDAHQFSAQANAFIAQPGIRVAACPLVENGVVRIMSSPHYRSDVRLPPQAVRDRLADAMRGLDGVFWPDDLSVRDDSLFDLSRVQGHNQITDLYLLGLAVHRMGQLVSFDQAIALRAVRGAELKHLLLL